MVPTILCGGAGSRLWPLSRDKYPKQLITLVGKETLLQATIRRLDGFACTEVELVQNPIVVCNEDNRFLVAEQIKETGSNGTSIILEPCGRNTAPALTVAALSATESGGNLLLLVMPADHVVEDKEAFHRAIERGIAPALSGAIVTFGIIPVRPETGYGYIQADHQTPLADSVFPILRFVEKPDSTTAEAYLATGDYCWNSGMFLLRAETWLRAMEQLQPVMLAFCRTAFERGYRDSDFLRLDSETFSACPTDSIDYAIMEKISVLSDSAIRCIMVTLDAGWSDVGAWDAVWQIGEKDDQGNAASGDVLLEDSQNSLIFATSRLVSCVGIDRMVIVETPDAVLIANKDKVQNVKKIVGALRTKSRQEGTSHRKVLRPWGWYDSLDQGEGFQVKRILVNPGAILSLQMHHHRSEHWIVVRGVARITLGEETILLTENQSTFIPVMEKHRVENPGQVPLEIIEIQSGMYLGEDDIIRLEDRYGRK
ncbi:mannose-1-phosphate guanylyltransferase (GDP) /mannose-6-phosphate isomerase, type 2 [Syntrophus gentianae]|uniref:mannose-1-phosphate guanylyltransferase n=1 Tax=Syntrophus gentianae TaxID=43775 RepID=A0A1H7YA51_9BACT|nr:mannose-1-phosphate guanylyltransferase/mannose-6-phosphate isomerase [Syntrophus gentianae]SEM42771.1 mannose-1-phosphate guanylyltransferase (GDP) /mannose-6-phosphate isomerase, type 2 [Syntrophus gentianae]